MIGGEVLRRLLADHRPVTVVIRASSRDEARRRLCDRLKKSASEHLLVQEQLTYHLADVSLPGWEKNFEGDPSLVIHCAASTMFNRNDTCWRTNVGGADGVIRLARGCSIPPRILHISTAFVCMRPQHSVLDERADTVGYCNGYTASKREAESRFRESGLDVVVLRPSIVFSRGIDDRRMARSILWSLLAAIALREVPIDPHSRLDIVPVDYVADAIRQIALKAELGFSTYHVSAGPEASVSVGKFVAAVEETCPEARGIRLMGSRPCGRQHGTDIKAERLAAALDHYLPFMNADIVYSSSRLRSEIGLGDSPSVTTYLKDMLRLINVNDAHAESLKL
jgi:nucleoside-diphosphate-sugar epimerase